MATPRQEVVAVFGDAAQAERALDALRDAGVPDEAVMHDSERARALADEGEMAPEPAYGFPVPTVVAASTPGMTAGWVVGSALGAVAGGLAGLLGAVAADAFWALGLLVGAVAGSVVGLVLGGAFGSLAVDQDHPRRPEDDTGGRLPAERGVTVGVHADDPDVLARARAVLERQRPVRVTVHH